jgi:hypothetical protein
MSYAYYLILLSTTALFASLLLTVLLPTRHFINRFLKINRFNGYIYHREASGLNDISKLAF